MFDFNEPAFSTAALLRCIPGLSHEAFKAWVHRGSVRLSSGKHTGTRAPQHAVHRGSDVLQVATLFELARVGGLLSKAEYIWDVVRGRMLARQYGSNEPGANTAIFCLDDRGSLVMRMFRDEDGDEGANLDAPDAPSTFLVFRIDRFIDAMVRRMEAV